MVRRLSQKLIFGICQNLIVKHISRELYQDILSQKEHAKHKVEVVMSFWQSEFYLAILYLSMYGGSLKTLKEFQAIIYKPPQRWWTSGRFPEENREQQIG